MITTRLLLCILMMLFTACGVCAALFPLMRKNNTSLGFAGAKDEFSLWYSDTFYSLESTRVVLRSYLRDSLCAEFRHIAMAGAALNVAGCGLGAIAALLAAMHVCARVKFNLCCTLMVMCFVTFAVFAASLTTVVFMYRGNMCVNSEVASVPSLHRQGYKLAEGFILLCVATGGFFITTFLEIIS